MSTILGISAFYHDSAAALLVDGMLVAAAQEERFSRKKHDAAFPVQAIESCLGGRSLSEIDHIVFYEKPLLKFERILETWLAFAPRGFSQFRLSMPSWTKEKLFLKQTIKKSLVNIDPGLGKNIPLGFTQHHEAHAASAFYPSPFNESAVLCVDGVGEWATTSAWMGQGESLTPLWEISFPHSLGLLYSAFTYYCGFKVNSGEYKLMGLAPYGNDKFSEVIKRHLIDIRSDGSFRLDLTYFDFHVGTLMISEKFRQLFGERERLPSEPIRQLDLDLAASIQTVTNEIMVRLARSIRQDTGATNLCLAGGVALNCVSNTEIVEAGVFDKVWIQPASGDAGGAVGAAYLAWHQVLGNKRAIKSEDSMQGALLGPSFSDEEIRYALDSLDAVYIELNEMERYQQVAELVANGHVVGWFQGRMEFGPRALGARSILGDARSPTMQKTLNLRTKGRESFRPFAPSVLAEDASEFFSNNNSPYMTLVATVNQSLRTSMPSRRSGLDQVNETRSSLPAVTHVDFTSRLQTVTQTQNPEFHRLLSAFKSLTGTGVMINTSFNVRGEPIVCKPADAFRCFMSTDMDFLSMGPFLLAKPEQTVSVLPSQFEDD